MSPIFRKKKIIWSKIINFQGNCYVSNKKKRLVQFIGETKFKMRLDGCNLAILMTVENTWSLNYHFIVNHNFYIGI